MVPRLLPAVLLVGLLLFVCALAHPQSRPSGQQRDAASAFEDGQNAQEHGDLTNAVKFYTEAISANGKLYQAYYQRGTAFMSLHRAQDAEADLKKALELEPTFTRAHRALGLLMLDRDRTDEAKRELARAIELEPQMRGVRICYASALIKSGQPAEALEHLRVAISQQEELPLATALLGIVLERTGKSQEALTAYEEALKLDPSNSTAREGRARLLESRGEIQKAIEDYTIAYRSQPSRDVALKLAALHTRAGQAQAAVSVYRLLLTEKSDDLEARAELARALSECGQNDEAQKEIGIVLNAAKGNSKYLLLAGDVFFKEKPNLASDYYRKALEQDPNNNRARVQLGSSLVRSLQYEEALQFLTEAIARDENNYAAHANLATALFKLKRYPESAREFIWVINAKPELPASYFFLAISLDKLGNCEQALRSYNEFLRRADRGTNKNELEEAGLRIGQLQHLISEKKCGGQPKRHGQ